MPSPRCRTDEHDRKETGASGDPMRTGTLTLSITSALDHVFLVGLSVRGICAGVSLDTACADAVELCVVEAVNNAIEHAYREQPGHPVEVDVEFESECLRIMVRDRG